MKKVIIVGGGIGGLIAANLLIRKGFEVVLYESHFAPGGYTAGFWRKGFYFESGTLSLEGEPLLFKVLKDLGVFDNITFVKHQIRHLAKDFDAVPSSYEDLKKIFFNAYPLEAKKWKSFFSEIDKMYCAFSGKGFWKRLLTLFYIFKYKKVSLEAYTEKFFEKNSYFYSLVQKFGFGYRGEPIWMAVFSLVCKFNDYWTVKGGMQSLADLLSKNFQKLGGQVYLNSLVEKIVTKKGEVQGVLHQGNFEKADAVIAACDYKETFLHLLDDTSKVDIKKIKEFEVSESLFTVYLGLKMSNEDLKKYLKVPYVDFYEKNLIEEFSFALYSPSLMNEALAPEGRSSLMILVGLSSEKKEYFRDKTFYAERKKEMKDLYIHKASSIISDLKKYIEIEDAATPFTYERYTHNTDGASSGWSWDVNKNFYSTFDCKVTTPIKNLFIGSCWASSFGGIPGAVSAAISCANKIEKSLNKK